MNVNEARDMLKKAVDPLLLAGIAAASLSGSLIGKKIGLSLRKKSLRERIVGFLKGASDRKAKTQKDRKQLHKLVKPVMRRIPYKTKGAKGWDVAVDAILGDTQSTGASK